MELRPPRAQLCVLVYSTTILSGGRNPPLPISLLSHPHPYSTSAGLGLYLPLHWQNSTHETPSAIIPSLHKSPHPSLLAAHKSQLQTHSSLSCGAVPSNSYAWKPAGPPTFLQQRLVCNHPLLHTSHQPPALCHSGILGAGLTGALTEPCLRHILVSVGNQGFSQTHRTLAPLLSRTGALRVHVLCPPWTCCLLLQAQSLTRATLGSCCSQKLSFWC